MITNVHIYAVQGAEVSQGAKVVCPRKSSIYTRGEKTVLAEKVIHGLALGLVPLRGSSIIVMQAV